MTSPDRAEADDWFLARGLPAVLPVRARWRHAWARSAPALTAYATVVLALLVVHLLSGSSEIYIDGAPTRLERIVLAVIALAVPVGVLLGWLVSRTGRRRIRGVIASAAAVIAVVASLLQGGIAEVPWTLVIIGGIVVLTGLGVGAILAWAMRLTGNQVAAMGALFVRALPVLLLTVVVFFNTYVWLLADAISQARLALALAFLFAVTAAFIASATLARVRPTFETARASHDDSHRLAGTPFAALPDPAVIRGLGHGERLNVVVVLVAAQVTHLLLVAISTAAIYFLLGLIVLSPAVLAKWTGGGTADGTVFGMTIPVPQSLIHVTLILCVLTFMYVCARSVGD
nr:hypothetical protein [Actinomycetota bacterium]